MRKLFDSVGKISLWILVSLIAVTVFYLKQPIDPKSPHILPDNKYSYHSVYPKIKNLMLISATSCNDLRTDTGYGKRRSNDVWDLIRFVLSNGRGELVTDLDDIEAWKKQEHVFNRKGYCVPYVDNLTSYLKTPRADVNDRYVALENGPLLVFPYRKPAQQPKKEKAPFSGAVLMDSYFVRVDKVKECSKDKRQFCASLSLQRKWWDRGKPIFLELTKEDYRVICWKCDKIRSSAKELQNAMLFGHDDGAINGWYLEIMLDGGYMISEKAFGRTGHIWGEDYTGERAKKKFETILSLIKPATP